ncbi:MAG: diheme cytochrome c-553 [Burkholderiaceae bacterium]
MKRRIPLEYAILGLAVAATAVIALPAHSQTAGGFAADKVARGKYLVSTSGCHDCHTPWKMGEKGPEPDMTRALSGHPETMALPPPPKADGPWIMSATATNTAWAGPWGISFTANLTPDPETGLGKWTQRNFTETIRTGRHMGRGREVLPPMPIPVYRNFTDADLESIFGYLQSLPAIRNRVPEPLPPTAAVAAKG